MINNYFKFKLLMWKHFTGFTRNCCIPLIEMLLPAFLFFMCMIILRRFAGIEQAEPVLYPPFNTSVEVNICSSANKSTIAVSPVSPFLHKTLSGICNNTEILEFESSSKLDSKLDSDDDFVQSLLFAVKFNDALKGVNSSKKFPLQMEITLRLPSIEPCGNFQEWFTSKQYNFNPTSENKPHDMLGGKPGYQRRGFLLLQQLITTALVNDGMLTPFNFTIELNRYPYPNVTRDHLFSKSRYKTWFNFFILFSLFCNFTFAVQNIGQEKEQKLKESMRVMGFPRWLNWVSWLARYFIIIFIAILLAVVIASVKIIEHAPLYPNSNRVILFIFLFLYAYSLLAASFVFVAFFKKESVATHVATFVFLLAFIFVWLTKRYSSNITNKVIVKGLNLLSPCIAYFGSVIISEYEFLGMGIQWSKIWETPITVEQQSVGSYILMFLLDSILYFFIGLYVDTIYPGEFGVSSPWYSLFTGFYFFKSPPASQEIHESLSKNQDYFEEDIGARPVGIHLKNLSKKFGTHTVVKSLTLEIYQEQITVLLGECGAGKTMILSLINGMYRPTTGTALVNGNDVTKNIDKVRSSLGICFQHNFLFKDLTASDHLYFFGRLKGMNYREIKKETEYYLEALELQSEDEVCASELSDNSKRKLCIAIALCGKSKVVLLDEPTGEMDPLAKQTVWKLLNQERRHRTILLTSSSLDEADILADKIAIMVAGQLQCYGSSTFLRNTFRIGYFLDIEITPNCQPESISKVLRKHSPNVQIYSHRSSELKYRLLDKEKANFEHILYDLESDKSYLGIQNYRISLATLEEAYMKSTEQQTKMSSEMPLDLFLQTVSGILFLILVISVICTSETAGSHSGFPLIVNQLYALWVKKVLSIYRSWCLTLFQILIPVSFLVVHGFVFRFTDIEKHFVDEPALNISLDFYISPIILLAGEKNEYYKLYKTLLKLNLPKTAITESYVAGASFKNRKITAWFNGDAYHSAPLALSLVLETIYRNSFGANYSMSFINHPFPFPLINFQLSKSTSYMGVVLARILLYGLPMSFPFFVLFYEHERTSGAKHLQFTSGVSVTMFWCISFLGDLIVAICIDGVIIITLAVFEIDSYDATEVLGFIMILLITSECYVLPYIYLFSLCFKNGFSYLFFTLYLGAMLPVVNVILIESDIVDYISMFLPLGACILGIYDLELFNTIKNLCSRFNNTETACKSHIKCCDIENYYEFQNPGLGANLLLPFILGMILFTLVICIDSGCCRFLCKTSECLIKQPQEVSEEEEIKEEINTITKSNRDTLFQNYALILSNVTKFHNCTPVVENIYIAIEPNECFGIFGINNAGKSCLFKMITNESRLSRGDIWIQGLNMKTDFLKIRKLIGYCPQYDPLFPNFTIRETLQMYALIHGVTFKKCSALSREFAQEFDFVKQFDQKVYQLSSSNRRKLSIAIALIGDPPIIFLDEPTSRMDPGSRRNVWNKLAQLRDKGKCIVICSESTEECEVLCTRVAIMVNGKFKCIGSIQKLKSKLAQDLILIIRIRKTDDDSDDKIMNVKKFILKYFPKAKLDEQYEELLKFYLPKPKLTLSEMYRLLERNQKSLDIEDYSLSQCNLEQVLFKFNEEE